MKSLFKAVRFSSLFLILGGLLSLGPAVNPSQSAEADEWTKWFSMAGFWCDGCCADVSVICCNWSKPCDEGEGGDPPGG